MHQWLLKECEEVFQWASGTEITTGMEGRTVLPAHEGAESSGMLWHRASSYYISAALRAGYILIGPIAVVGEKPEAVPLELVPDGHAVPVEMVLTDAEQLPALFAGFLELYTGSYPEEAEVFPGRKLLEELRRLHREFIESYYVRACQFDEKTLELLQALYQHTDRTGSRLFHAKNRVRTAGALLSRAALENGAEAETMLGILDTVAEDLEKARAEGEVLLLEKQMYAQYYQRMHEETEADNPAFIARIRRYIEEHLNEPITTSSIAEQMNLHPNYLSSKFRAHSDMTLMQFIHQQRIERAKQELLETNRPIQDIAVSLQYGSQPYFTAVFKKHTGTTPKKYRALQV
ncbi:helix-turn-helix transcriptional regulator [Alkalicoccus urumqiensis]|uniref:HTH araC/xylS-type domain-containing protein n=1 Tax=Alkalicoccus urumqiensis TaxID=1548213 RepID=A0A2P6MIH1_ALKUR|nr:AraC family transcriptional regulator [Alkalicoccus urumqiensis]PRO66079.1 hypothetical protein C6I21_07215 [Alkalicoccus urumqiensis]